MRPLAILKSRSHRPCLLLVLTLCGLLASAAGGCTAKKITDGPEPEPDNHVPVFKKTTQDIAKFDPAAGRVESDSKIEATDPVFGPLQAVGPMLQKTASTAVDSYVANFYALNGKWPTYDEFMTQIIKELNVQLPVLPAKMEYQYDEARHKLIVVYPKKEDDPKKTDDKPK